ncbi:UNVERIFIED_CONTAM: hypothetical protein HDU68_003178 [Siphonaria sp. JEL0065]|nr:hypothetical protein HDU68_003178 [Siphonaria sp. JEL0065]
MKCTTASLCIGIDLGTHQSLLSVFDARDSTIKTLDVNGRNNIPSAVLFSSNGAGSRVHFSLDETKLLDEYKHQYGANVAQVVVTVPVSFTYGGGTIDLSILEASRFNDCLNLTILNTVGNHALGGNDFTNELYWWAVDQIGSQVPVSRDDFETIKDVSVLTEKIENHLTEALKTKLVSVLTSAVILVDTDSKDSDYSEVVQDKTFTIDLVIPVGGASCMPLFRKCIEKQLLGVKIATSMDPYTAVSMGASLQSAILTNCWSSISRCAESLPHSLGIEIKPTKKSGYTVSHLLYRLQPLPHACEKIFETEVGCPYLSINVVEGESRRKERCTPVGNIVCEVGGGGKRISCQGFGLNLTQRGS